MKINDRPRMHGVKILSALAIIFLSGTTLSRAAVVVWEDFEATTLSDGSDIPAANITYDRGLASWTVSADSDLLAESTGALSGSLSGKHSNVNSAKYNTANAAQILYEIGGQYTNMTVWCRLKIRTDQVPTESLRFGLHIGGGMNPSADASLGWYPSSSVKWRDRYGNITTSTDPVATPAANTTYDVLFEIAPTTYDVWVNDVQIFDDALLSTFNTGGNQPFNFAVLTSELAPGGTTKVLFDDFGLFNANPRIGTEIVGTDFLLVNGLQSTTRIDDGVKDGEEVIWTSQNGAFSAYSPDGSVVRGVMDIQNEDSTEAHNPVDFAAGGDYLGYFASALNTGGPNDLESKNTEVPNSLFFNAGLAGFPKIVTAGQRMESSILTDLMFVADPVSDRVRRYRMDSTAFIGYSALDASIDLAVDLAYAAGPDLLFWATSDGKLYKCAAGGGTPSLVLSDARIDSGSKINAGSWNGTVGVLVSYNDGNWVMVAPTGTTLATTGTFTDAGGANPLDVAFGTDRFYYLVPDGTGGSRLYTVSYDPPPTGTVILIN